MRVSGKETLPQGESRLIKANQGEIRAEKGEGGIWVMGLENFLGPVLATRGVVLST
jgi:hypothetical protein